MNIAKSINTEQSKNKMTVYDRLYNSKTHSDCNKWRDGSHPKSNLHQPKKTIVKKKPRNLSAKIPSTRSRSGFSNWNRFCFEDGPSEAQFKTAKKRVPTPVMPKEKVTALEKSRGDYLSMSAKERITVYNSDQKLPKFASENPSWKSHFSDHVDSHPLTEFDDDLEDNLGDLLKSIKKQNDNLMNKIQCKKQGKLEFASTIEERMKNKVIGVPLNEFQTPDVRRLKNNTMNINVFSPIKTKNFLNTHDASESVFSGKFNICFNDENWEVYQFLNFYIFLFKIWIFICFIEIFLMRRTIAIKLTVIKI